MLAAGEFLIALTIVLSVAAVTTVVFQRLHQPVVLGYILAGLIVGPHTPVPVFVSQQSVHTLSELGVVLLMFGLGLEFTLSKLLRALPNAGTTAILQASAMMWLGYVVASALGWSGMDSVFLGAVIAISSTTIIAKAFDEQGVKGRLRELVVAILIVEDLIAVLIMTVLIAVASGAGLSANDLAETLAKLGGFLLALVVGGMLIVPRAMRAIVRRQRAETTIVATMAVCFGSALLAHFAGYSVALGAFVGGVLVAESKDTRQIEPLVLPVRDVFAAVFFVSVGMMLDPAVLVEHAVEIVLITLVVIVGKVASVAFGAFITGNGTRTAIAAGMSLAQIGEFSFIIAGLGVSLGVVGSQLYPVAVAVSALTTLTTPWLIRAATPLGAWIDRKLPGPLQTVVALYEGWIERMRMARRESQSQLRRHARAIGIDMAVVATLVIGFAIGFDDLVGALVDTGIAASASRIIVAIAAGLVVMPFCVGILLATRRFARTLATTVVPATHHDALDLGRAPRRTLQAIVQLGGVAIVGVALLALTQPFLPAYTAAIVLLATLLVLAVVAWRAARNLHGHVRAVTNALVEAITLRASGGHHPHVHEVHHDHAFAGIGNPTQVLVVPGSIAAGRSLSELSLRASTGATVLAIVRDGAGIVSPDAHDPLRPGDVVALTGTHDAIAAARELLAMRADAELPSGV